MDLRTGPRELIAEWIIETSGVGGHFLPDVRVLAAFEGERLLGAVAYDAFNARDCNMHVCIADHRFMSRRVLRAVFDYPFRQLKLERVSAQVMSNNDKSLEFVQRVGFVYEGAKRLAGFDMQMLFGMLKHECRWVTEPVEFAMQEVVSA